MKNLRSLLVVLLVPLALFFMQCNEEVTLNEPFVDSELDVRARSSSKGRPSADVGNNLSFPVIWSEGVSKILRGAPGDVNLEGEWYYVWGEDPIDPAYDIFSCKPLNPELNDLICVGDYEAGDGVTEIYKAYVQKDPNNEWQAFSMNATGPLYVDKIDWGDNLESVDWNLRSQVRTEVVLYEALAAPETQYAMRHCDGWGASEVHGLQTTLDDEIQYGPGDWATVYSDNARLTIQKLNIERDDPNIDLLEWNSEEGLWEGEADGEPLINAPIFNMPVYESGDGPGYYNAEVNVKGKVIYGYTWNVRKLNQGAGDYRLTFSFDEWGNQALNTYFDEDTYVDQPIEVIIYSSDSGGGAVGIIDVENNLTYMDVRILSKSNGKRR